MEKVTFQVQGSSPSPYRVDFEHDPDGRIRAFCTCQAGQNGTYCKHRMSILLGVKIDIVSGNSQDASKVASWLKGSRIENAIYELSTAEEIEEQAKAKVAWAKKNLSAVLLGHY